MPVEVIEALRDEDRARAESVLGVTLADGLFLGASPWIEARIAYLEEHPGHPWRMFSIVAERTMVGHIGYHGPPDDNEMLEIGYTIAAPYRRRGYATEAAEALVANAFAHDQVSIVRACVAPTNEPSLGLVAKLGFVQVGEQMDEIDGLELVFERRRST